MNHDDYPLSYTRDVLLGVRTIAIVGASSNPARPSYFVLKYLTDKGFDCYAVNPAIAGELLLGRPVARSLADVPVAIDMVDIFRNSAAAGAVVAEALELDPLPKVIWMQLSVRNDAAAALAEARGLRVVMNRCPKIEYGKHSGEWTWIGGNANMVSSQRLSRHQSGRLQSLGIAAPTDKTSQPRNTGED